MDTQLSATSTDGSLLWTTDDLGRQITQEKTRGDVIRGMIPTASVNIAVGESGLGKSPLMYDLCIRVAASLPFVGFEVASGPTVMMDFENGAERHAVCETLIRTAGLKRAPQDFYHDPEPGQDLEKKIRAFRPRLVVIDSLRMFAPEALKPDGVEAAKMLKRLQALAHNQSTSFILIHHVRKEDRKAKPADLAATPVLEWLQEASGSRSFINQTDTRIAIAHDRNSRNGEECLILKYFMKLRGEFGPIHIERMFQQSQAVGYRRLTGKSLLRNSEHEKWFDNLPEHFRHGEAERITGKHSGALSHFLKKCDAAGILEKTASGYRKIDQGQIH